MELKRGKVKHINNGQFVLIVPLWNWNQKESASFVDMECLNRTFMELKLTQGVDGDYVVECLNRTFMELKHYTWEGAKAQEFVLIVPLWNWNCKLFTYFRLQQAS